MKVSLFVPCYVDQMHPEIGFAVAEVLTRLGHEVEVPEGQTCCGQPAMNNGYEDETRTFSTAFYIVHEPPWRVI